MANTKSAKKRNRQMIVRTARNRAIKSRVKSARKAALAAILTGDKEVIAAKVALYASTADKAANKNVIHKNAASRFKARIAAAIAKASAAPAAKA
jgi:small subunit ribosomal protein S20